MKQMVPKSAAPNKATATTMTTSQSVLRGAMPILFLRRMFLNGPIECARIFARRQIPFANYRGRVLRDTERQRDIILAIICRAKVSPLGRDYFIDPSHALSMRLHSYRPHHYREHRPQCKPHLAKFRAHMVIKSPCLQRSFVPISSPLSALTAVPPAKAGRR